MSEWLSLYEIAKAAKMPESTVRRYAALFGEFLFAKKTGVRAVKYRADNVRTFQKIAALYSEGMTQIEIQERLRSDQEAIQTVDISQPIGKDEPSSLIASDALLAVLGRQADVLATIHSLLENQKEIAALQNDEIRRLRAEVDALRQEKAEATSPATDQQNQVKPGFKWPWQR